MLPLKITCTCHQAKITIICCKMPKIAQKISTRQIWNCHQIRSLTTPGTKALKHKMQISDHIIDSTHTSSHTSVNNTGQILLLIWSVSQHLKKPKRRIKILYESLLQEIMIFATATIITIGSQTLLADVMRIRPTCSPALLRSKMLQLEY